MSAPKTNRLYDPATTDLKSAMSKRLAEFTREDLFICLPARIVGIDEHETRQVINVELIIEERYKDGRVLSPLILKSVFVKTHGGGDFYIKFPVAIGGYVTLHWAHRTINDWLDGDGSNIEQPMDYTALAKDCYADIGFGTRKVNQSPSAENLIIEGPNSSITMKPNGDFIINTKGNVEVVSEGTATVTAASATINCDTTVDGTLTASKLVAPSVVANGKELAGHNHAINSGSSAPGPTGSNN